jgi:hypothetical protein
MQRVILAAELQQQPWLWVDHRDHDGLNNQRCNLRLATPSANACNIRKRAGTTSRFLGVYWNKRMRRWHAQIKAGGRRHSLGLFDREEDAAAAYDNAAREWFGEFATLNLQAAK